MMGLSDFQIIFQKPIATYFSGETVHGQILINLSDSKNFQKIEIELVGEGNVNWTETRYLTLTLTIKGCVRLCVSQVISSILI